MRTPEEVLALVEHMNGAGRVFFAYAELLEDAAQRAGLQFAEKLHVDEVLQHVRAWAQGQSSPSLNAYVEGTPTEQGFEALAQYGFVLVHASTRIVAADAVASSAWLARALALTIRRGPSLTPDPDVNNAVTMADTYIIAVCNRTGTFGVTSVPTFLARVLGDQAEG